jgi:hypothetical protein
MEWKVATSIHKKGDKKKCENYRGISVNISKTGRIRTQEYGDGRTSRSSSWKVMYR